MVWVPVCNRTAVEKIFMVGPQATDTTCRKVVFTLISFNQMFVQVLLNNTINLQLFQEHLFDIWIHLARLICHIQNICTNLYTCMAKIGVKNLAQGLKSGYISRTCIQKQSSY